MIWRVDGGYDAVQSSIAETHDCDPNKIQTLKQNLQLNSNEKLRIFFAVPPPRYKNFQTDPVDPLAENNQLDNVYVYHLSITKDD